MFFFNEIDYMQTKYCAFFFLFVMMKAINNFGLLDNKEDVID